MKKTKSPQYVEDIVLKSYATLEMSSPFKNVDVAFNWLNREYPIYHKHSHWEILIIMSGKILHTINGMEYIMKKGDACIIRPTDEHSLKYTQDYKDYGEPYQHLNFIFHNDFAEKVLGLYESYDTLLHSQEVQYFTLDDSDIDMIYNKALFTQYLPQEKYEMSTKLIVSHLLNRFLERRMLFEPEYPDWLNVFLTYISNPTNFGKSVEELSESTGYSYSRLARVFKSYTGVTLIEYINDKKMTYAKRLLRTTNLTTLQISEKIGYSSLSSFNHLFKKVYGIPPSEYRKKHHERTLDGM